ncbi:hypothetical protein RCG23_00375 [Neobacillus sp. PS3-34]|uniref:hypothetical protein n=1 Tax=Neobacillus sp. PS3-34 TaxID=3070678 RepID=UPI0027E1D7A7|nr:hypothetical protein [Neobacillus sp. PS3-34]WML48648.1 hypothetical protein RCG23_00375 [Neobacillus sp. PS3-34]
MKSQGLFWLRLLIAVVCFILSIYSFFSKTDLLPIMFTLMSVLFFLNGLDIAKYKNQPKEMGYFYFFVGGFMIITTIAKTLFS